MIGILSTVVLAIFLPISLAHDPKEMAKYLLSLLDDDTPAKGEEWPQIPGLNTDDRVCIVGAGASGIHMAVSLKNKHYKDVKNFLCLMKGD